MWNGGKQDEIIGRGEISRVTGDCIRGLAGLLA